MGCRDRIVLLTSRAAERIVRHFASEFDCVEVEVLPVNVASFLSAEALEALIERDPRLLERLRGASLVVAPGLVKGDLSHLSERLGVEVVKGTRSASGIPALLEHIKSRGRLSPREPADYMIGGRVRLRAERALRLGPVEVPLRGPPLLIASEVPPGRSAREAARLVGEGADIIVVGVLPSDDPNRVKSAVREALDASSSKAAILTEAPTPSHVRAAVEAGAHGVVASPEVALASSDHLKGLVTVVGDRDIDSLFLALEALRSRGVKVIADPVLDAPLIGFASSLERYIEASERLEAPLVFSAANASTEVEADTHGIHALLAAIALEVGASIYYVVEDRYKDLHSTAEAVEAASLAERAYEASLTERGLASRLLIVKQAQPPPPSRLPPGRRVDNVPPRLDPAGYFIVDVDHSRGVIIVEFRGAQGTLRLEGRSARDLARALLREARVSLEHAAYLGYELCKAELALRLGLTYIQDEDLLRPPWVADA